jgi:ADP-ribosylglycohydrolase
MEFNEKLRDKVYACWLGKTIAGGLGAPFEGIPYSPNLKPEDLLLDTGPNDDLELQLLWLTYAEKYGLDLDSEKLTHAWANVIKYGMDEYGVAIWNIRRGLKPPETGFVDNFFTHGMGAAIRSEVWACLCPGKPEAAAYFAMCDSSIDHCGEGVWAEMFLAAAESSAFYANSMEEAFNGGLEHISSDSNIYQVIKYVMAQYASGTPIEEVGELVMKKFANHNFTDVVMNLSFIAIALLYGEGDFEKSVLIAINFGYDTDCTAATAGGIFGILYGSEAISQKWREIVSDEITVSDFLRDLSIPQTITGMTDRTIALSEKIMNDPRIEQPFPEYIPITEMDYPFQSSEWRVLTGFTVEAVDEIVKSGKLNELSTVEKFKGIHLNLAKFAKDNISIDLFTNIVVEEDQECQLMACSETGMTVWLDDKQIINQHNRQKPIPAFHRVDGGASVKVSLKAGKSHKLRVRLIFCQQPLTLTVALGDMMNQYINFLTHA